MLKLKMPVVAQTLEMSYSELVALRKEIDKMVSNEETIYLQNTINNFQSYTTLELKTEIQKIFKILKIKKGIHDIRSFASYVNVESPNNYKTGLTSKLYNNKEAMTLFIARILKHYGILVNGKYTITFPE